jgi:hypothetical protein
MKIIETAALLGVHCNVYAGSQEAGVEGEFNHKTHEDNRNRSSILNVNRTNTA